MHSSSPPEPICYQIALTSDPKTHFYLLGTIHAGCLAPNHAAKIEYVISNFANGIQPRLLLLETDLFSPRARNRYGTSYLTQADRIPSMVETILAKIAMDFRSPIQGLTDPFAYFYAVRFSSITVMGKELSSDSYRRALVNFPALTLSTVALATVFLAIAIFLGIRRIGRVLALPLALPEILALSLLAALWALQRRRAPKPAWIVNDGRNNPSVKLYAQSFQHIPAPPSVRAFMDHYGAVDARDEQGVTKIQALLQHSGLSLSQVAWRSLHTLDSVLTTLIEPAIFPKSQYRTRTAPPSPTEDWRAFHETLSHQQIHHSLPHFEASHAPLVALGTNHLPPILYAFHSQGAKIQSVDLLTAEYKPYSKAF